MPDDQTPPNTTTLWENYNSHVACKMAKGHVCAKWIYSFSGAEAIAVVRCPFKGVGRGGKVSAPDPGERAWVPLSLEVSHRLSNPDYAIIYFVEYITYLCTKITIDSQSAMTSGCLEQTEGSYVKKVCACRSYAGQTPCNSASHPITNIIILLVTAITILHA
uniref:Uncharacterized protein n=1 Tax=Timema poppense TaxID=170557 RepID=A0A7R9DJM5_TIMPO|nr:unnamed protein product [Timema poppensis]